MIRLRKRPFLNYLYLLIVLVNIAWIIDKVRLGLGIKAADLSGEPSSQAILSQWEPVDLTAFREDALKKVADMESEKIRLSKQVISLDLKTKSIKTIDREMQVQNILLENYEAMDTSGDGRIDQPEFKEKIGKMSAQVYRARHTPNPSYLPGIYDSDWNFINVGSLTIGDIPGNDVVMVFVEGGIFETLKEPYLQIYEESAESTTSHDLQIYICNDCTKEQIYTLSHLDRNFQSWQAPKIKGLVMVGDLPSAWLKTTSCYAVDHPPSGFNETFPTDLYFMAKNESFAGGIGSPESPFNTVDTTHINLEKFIGRIQAPSELMEETVIKKYFNKLYAYRRGWTDNEKRSLVYIDNPWSDTLANQWNYDLAQWYQGRTLIDNVNITNASRYKEEIKKTYENIFTVSHAGGVANQHRFLNTDGSATYVNSVNIREVKPPALFYSIWTCTAGLFTHPDYLLGSYVFQDKGGLEAFGSSKITSIKDVGRIYKPLGKYSELAKSFGLAHQYWVSSFNIYNYPCEYGYVLIGDPTLEYERFYNGPDNQMPAIIHGSIDLRGRPVPPHPNWSIPLEVTLSGGPSAATYETISDQYGKFTIGEIIPGVYGIKIKNERTLSNILSHYILFSGDNEVNLGLLVGGDTNQDDYINTLDLSLVAYVYGTSFGEPKFDSRADINYSGNIELFDLVMIGTGFGKYGPLNQVLSETKFLNVSDKVNIKLNLQTPFLAENEIFLVDIQLKAGFQPVYAAEVYLTYDPAYLQVVDQSGNPINKIEDGSILEKPLLNKVEDNIISYAASTDSGNLPSGNFDLAKIRFKALKKTGDQGTHLNFAFRTPVKSEIAYAGESVLGETQGKKMIIFDTCPDKELGNLNCDPERLINEIDLSIFLNSWGDTYNLDELNKVLSYWKT